MTHLLLQQLATPDAASLPVEHLCEALALPRSTFYRLALGGRDGVAQCPFTAIAESQPNCIGKD